MKAHIKTENSNGTFLWSKCPLVARSDNGWARFHAWLFLPHFVPRDLSVSCEDIRCGRFETTGCLLVFLNDLRGLKLTNRGCMFLFHHITLENLIFCISFIQAVHVFWSTSSVPCLDKYSEQLVGVWKKVQNNYFTFGRSTYFMVSSQLFLRWSNFDFVAALTQRRRHNSVQFCDVKGNHSNKSDNDGNGDFGWKYREYEF